EPPLRHALALQPGEADLWNNLALVLEKRARAPEALVCLERAVQLRADFALARENLERLSRLPLPSPAHHANNRGVELLGERRLDEAEASFRRALTLKHDLPESALNLAKILLLKKQFP